MLKAIVLCFLVIVYARKQKPTPPGSALESIIASTKNTTKLWVKIFDKKTADGQPDNVVFSVVGIHCLLAWLSLGTDGDSKTQLVTALGIPQDESLVIQAAREVNELIEKGNGSKVNSGNGLFVEKNLLLKTEFLNVSKEAFKAEVQSVDFASSDTVKVINAWVNKVTEGHIPAFMETVDSSNILLLLNVLHFKGKWATPFPVENTKKDIFQCINGKNVSVDFMSIEGSFEVIENAELKSKFINLPYDNPDLIFTLVLPNIGEALPTIEESLARKINRLIKLKGVRTSLTLSLPKFKVHSDFNLIEGLKTLGIVDIFDPSKANLSRLTDKASHVSEVFQKTTINVDEIGTEASAVSGALGTYSASLGVKVDRPFLFAVSCVKSKLPFFLGRVTMISEAKGRKKTKSKKRPS